MAKKSKSPKAVKPAVVKELRSSVKKLERDLEKAQAKAERWKATAKQHAADAAATSKKLAKKEKAWAKARIEPVTQAPPTSAPAVASETPDDTWNITRLRAAARAKRVTNYSRKSKAQLIEDLNA